jgi:hypothetical protein
VLAVDRTRKPPHHAAGVSSVSAHADGQDGEKNQNQNDERPGAHARHLTQWPLNTA